MIDRAWSVLLVFGCSAFLLAMVLSGTQGASANAACASSQNLAASTEISDACRINSFTFGADDWITSAPSHTILAEMTVQTQTYPALVATQYGLGKAVYAPGSVFSEINNLIAPHNARQEVFLNSVRWVTNQKAPTQTTVLVTWGHRELVTYGWNNACCSTDIVEALRDEGYNVDIVEDIPAELSCYDVVIMSGVGWYLEPDYPDPTNWSGDSGHAPTPAEVTSLLDFVKNGGGLVASIEYWSGADWMRPIMSPMSVTVQSVDDARDLTGIRISDHFILTKPCFFSYLPVIHR